jgi:hypothetical protein
MAIAFGRMAGLIRVMLGILVKPGIVVVLGIRAIRDSPVSGLVGIAA